LLRPDDAARSRLTILALGPAIFVVAGLAIASRSDLALAQAPSRAQVEPSARCAAAGGAAKKRDDIDPAIHPRQSPIISAPARSASWRHCAGVVGSGTANSSRRGGLISSSALIA